MQKKIRKSIIDMLLCINDVKLLKESIALYSTYIQKSR